MAMPLSCSAAAASTTTTLNLRDLDLTAEVDGAEGKQPRCDEIEGVSGRDCHIFGRRCVLARRNADARSPISRQIGVRSGDGTVGDCYGSARTARRAEQARGGAVDHRIASCLLNSQQHPVVGPKGASELDAANDEQEEDWQDEGSFNRRRTFFPAAPRWSALGHWTRISVLAVSEVGITPQDRIGVKAWLAVTVTNTRLGVFPAPTQVVPQVIELPSSHSQLGEGSLGNVSAGLKLPEFCTAFLMPVMQLEDWMPV